MEKTKLGLSTAIMGALVCLLAIFGGYTVVILLTGYILICEKDRWLRTFSVSILLYCLAFSLVLSGLGFVRNLVLASDLDGEAFLYWVMYAVRILGKLGLLGLGAASFMGMKLKLPLLSTILDKHLNHPEA